MNDDELFNISLSNVINGTSWEKTDILYLTPIVLSHILENKNKFNPFDINPKTIIIDEFDELLYNPQLSSHVVLILQKFGVLKGNPPSNTDFSPEVNKHRQFIFCGSTIPKQLYS